MKLLIRLTLNVIALLVVSYLIAGVKFDSLTAVVVAAIVIGVVNTFIKPVLQILFLPLSIVTLGVTAFLINVFSLWGVSYIVKGFTIDGFLTAVLASVALTLISLFLNKLAENKDK